MTEMHSEPINKAFFQEEEQFMLKFAFFRCRNEFFVANGICKIVDVIFMLRMVIWI